VLNRNNHHTLDAKDHDRSMSHLGHSRPNWAVRVMSGLPPVATVGADLPVRQLRANAPCRSFHSMPSRRPAPRFRRALSPRSQKHQSIHALAVAATCALSRSSCAGNSRNTSPRQFRQRSGSTPHDDETDARHMQVRSMSVLASSRQRYPLHRHVNVAVRQNSKAQDCVTKAISVTRSQPNSRPCRVAKLRTLLPRSATSTPAPAAKPP
jgi:hypothetical protein